LLSLVCLFQKQFFHKICKTAKLSRASAPWRPHEGSWPRHGASTRDNCALAPQTCALAPSRGLACPLPAACWALTRAHQLQNFPTSCNWDFKAYPTLIICTFLFSFCPFLRSTHYLHEKDIYFILFSRLKYLMLFEDPVLNYFEYVPCLIQDIHNTYCISYHKILYWLCLRSLITQSRISLSFVNAMFYISLNKINYKNYINLWHMSTN
jgi:hypothetical protein